MYIFQAVSNIRHLPTEGNIKSVINDEIKTTFSLHHLLESIIYTYLYRTFLKTIVYFSFVDNTSTFKTKELHLYVVQKVPSGMPKCLLCLGI